MMQSVVVEISVRSVQTTEFVIYALACRANPSRMIAPPAHVTAHSYSTTDASKLLDAVLKFAFELCDSGIVGHIG